MSRKKILITSFVLILVGGYFIGPVPETPVYEKVLPVVPADPDLLEKYVASLDAGHKIKEDNQARIVWADSTRARTPYVVVYLHGFSASQAEGDPVHRDFAKKFGMNLYLARLADHGVDTTEQLLYFTPDRWWKSAQEALMVGKQLGDQVILMSTSTGGTVALQLAAAYPDEVSGLINMSPNIAINDPNAWLLNNPWGLQIARLVIGSDTRTIQYDSARQHHWNGNYRVESIVQLEQLIETSMNKSTFEAVKCPVLNMYYYKSEDAQDPVVKVSAILDMHAALGTPESQKRAVPIPEAGNHVLGSKFVPGDLPAVQEACRSFAVEVLQLKEINP